MVDVVQQSITPRRRGLSSKWWLGTVRFCLSLGIVLALWEISTTYFGSSALIPSFSQVAVRAYDLIITGTLFLHAGASLARILTGFLIGSAIGVPLGLAMGTFPGVRSILDPFVQFFRFVPSIAWLTPAVIWFGIGEVSKIAIIVYVTIFIVAVSSMIGVLGVAPNKIWAAITLGANRWQIFFYVILPASLPAILTGMRVAMGNSFTSVVSAEMISANEGLGYLIFDSRLWMATDTIFVAILVLGFLGFGADTFFRVLIRRFGGRFGAVE